jgi:hypothetical protein
MTTRPGGEETHFLSPLFLGLSSFFMRTFMETELLGIVLGVVLPIYPMLFIIYQKIGRYDEIVEEFRKLRSEHETHKEHFHGN